MRAKVVNVAGILTLGLVVLVVSRFNLSIALLLVGSTIIGSLILMAALMIVTAKSPVICVICRDKISESSYAIWTFAGQHFDMHEHCKAPEVSMRTVNRHEERKIATVFRRA